MRLNPAIGSLEGNRVSIATLAQLLSEQAISGRPVIDKTGLKGLYDFALEWTPEAGPAAPVIAKGPSEFLVIDSVGRPSGN
jgi:uncharacterized protein (TIGR03435 family)